MGCNCGKKKIQGQVLGSTSVRTAVYQVVKDGQTISEHSTPAAARMAAAESSGRVRITSRSASNAVS